MPSKLFKSYMSYIITWIKTRKENLINFLNQTCKKLILAHVNISSELHNKYVS